MTAKAASRYQTPLHVAAANLRRAETAALKNT